VRLRVILLDRVNTFLSDLRDPQFRQPRDNAHRDPDVAAAARRDAIGLLSRRISDGDVLPDLVPARVREHHDAVGVADGAVASTTLLLPMTPMPKSVAGPVEMITKPPAHA
jgi:hypothetical protein